MTAITSQRNSRASRAAGQAAKDQPQPEAKPEKPTEPYAIVSGQEVHIPVYRGQVQVCAPTPDGQGETVETLSCECKWAHTTPEIAERCARKLIAGRGLKVQAAS